MIPASRFLVVTIFTLFLLACSGGSGTGSSALQTPRTHSSVIGEAWAGSSINATIFRRNSIVSHGQYQFVAYYDAQSRLTLARRDRANDDWEVRSSRFTGDTADAHNSISIMVDGNGYLHVSWDHHVDELNYAVSLDPLSLELGPPEPMLGVDESQVTYPEFYQMPNGDLIFAYRDGRSGRGQLIMNRYVLATRQWQRIGTGLIDGERERNPYWQLHVDSLGSIHVSWVWRETSDVSTNHDMHYAVSRDAGESWQRSDGSFYVLPIRQADAEIIWPIPQNSNLMNQTTMTSDAEGNPYIATYFRAPDTPVTQIRMLYFKRGAWRESTVSDRQADFELAGGGTRSPPISRPQIVIDSQGKPARALIIYRDEEWDDQVVLASTELNDDGQPGADELDWQHHSLTEYSVDRWEPSIDTALWRDRQTLHLYVQTVSQLIGNEIVERDPTPVTVLQGDTVVVDAAARLFLAGAGNIVGGSGLFAVLAYAQVSQEV